MVARNPHMAKLAGSYLFPEIKKRALAFLAKEPSAKLISLSIGDTSEPIPPFITESLSGKAAALGSLAGYQGYGPEQGIGALKEALAERFYGGTISPEEIFVSDGAKCDIARLQMLFGSDKVTAVQDPAYPVYVDTSVIMGQTGHYETKGYNKLVYLPCHAENNFFPLLDESVPAFDLLYFCNPNNPTGAVCTKAQLQELIAFVKKRKALLIYDAAYSIYIQDPDLPRSIFEIEGARDVAIEINSFSKIVGFTGVRLSWTVVPKTVTFDDGFPLINDWNRIMITCFNGASIISQHGGIAALSPQGFQEVQEMVQFYLRNARLMRASFEKLGFTVFGGEQMPYLWVKTKGISSWEAFDHFLHHHHLIVTPGSGFGPAGEGYIRLSSFGHRETIESALERLAPK